MYSDIGISNGLLVARYVMDTDVPDVTVSSEVCSNLLANGWIGGPAHTQETVEWVHATTQGIRTVVLGPPASNHPALFLRLNVVRP